MSKLVVCAPLGFEARAVRRGIGSGGEVRQTGYGARRSARQADALRADGFGMLAIAGVGGGVAAGLTPGDLVVGTEVSGPDGLASCPSALLLAGELRRAGLRTHAGKIATVPKIVHGAERQLLARGGALAGDMGAAVLLDGAGGPPAGRGPGGGA